MTTKTKTRISDAEMIASPDEWPAWPFLPLKRYVKDESGPQCRLLWVGAPLTLFDANLFSLPKNKGEFRKLPQTTYESVDAILADGWIVD